LEFPPSFLVMKIYFLIAALASIGFAAPQIPPQNGVPPKAGTGPAGSGGAAGRTAKDFNEVLDGPCKDVFLIYARATMEPGNLVNEPSV
jgi:hypothetical protein